MSKTLYTVVRDSREHDGNGYVFYHRKKCAGMVEKKLQIGDYSIQGLEKVLAIERKGSLTELIKNMYVEKEQWIKRLTALSSLQYPFLILDFPPSHIDDIPHSILSKLRRTPPYSRISPQDIKDKLDELRHYGITVIFAVSEDRGERRNRQIGRKIAGRIFDIMSPLLDGTPISSSSLLKISAYQFS